MAAAPQSKRTVRRTQAERSAETRGRLVDATIACLVEFGTAGTTTLAVCKRAGVSHGSMLHHFGTRERLLAVALDAIYARLREPVLTRLAELPDGEDRIDALVELMWGAFGAPEFKAVIELWLAAANDPSVSWAVLPEAQAFDAAIQPLAASILPEVARAVPDFDVHISLLFQVLQGMGLAAATFPPSEEGDAMRARVRSQVATSLRAAYRAARERGGAPA